mgnify:CR=1 FL=1
MTIDEKINDDYIPVEEVSANELKTTSYIQIFIQKIIEIVKSFWSKKNETL